jgi:hypothetical protein
MSCVVQIVRIIPEELMKGVSYARFFTNLCLVNGFVKQRWPQGKANAFKSISDKNSEPNPSIILSNLVQYWTAIYSDLTEDADTPFATASGV